MLIPFCVMRSSNCRLVTGRDDRLTLNKLVCTEQIRESVSSDNLKSLNKGQIVLIENRHRLTVSATYIRTCVN